MWLILYDIRPWTHFIYKRGDSTRFMRSDKNKHNSSSLILQLVGLHKSWMSGSRSPSYRSTSGALSPDWASPPFPGSPLLHRRTARAVTPLPVGVDGSPLGSVNSCSPCPSPISLESETERLNRWVWGGLFTLHLLNSHVLFGGHYTFLISNKNNDHFLLSGGHFK